MIFKKLLSISTMSIVLITSSSFKLNNYRARAAQIPIDTVQTIKNDLTAREKIYNETGINIPKKVPKEHISTIYKESKKRNVPLKILIKVIQIESDFNSKALNKNSGAKGYMQLTPSTYKLYRKKLNLTTSPINNIKIGTYYLKEMYNVWNKSEYSEHKKWKLALASYNAGVKRVLKDKKVPNIKETRDFVDYTLE